MAFPSLDVPLAGTSVPLSALRSHLGTGVGEFPDLILLGRWCRDAGLSLIQILPINDTGYESSPYSALSAFALHPVYLRLADLPGASAFDEKIRALGLELNGRVQVDHSKVWAAKEDLLRQIFPKAGFGRKDAEEWLKERPWGREYAVFWALRERYQRRGWQDWPDHRNPDSAEIQRLWDELGTEAMFPVWQQVHAEKQLLAAVRALEDLGVALKGDLPILLNEDSADVWAHPEYFDLNLRAGAPPDGMNPEGQNWGFPIYRWDRLAKDGYGWWKARLTHAARFYQAYRIDHVLGFFRIWATPHENLTAQLGHFIPTPALTEAQLRQLGFDESRLVWMSEPHVFGVEWRERLGDEAQAVADAALIRIGNEDLFRFQPQIRGERDILRLPVSEKAQGILLLWFRDRALMRQGKNFAATSQYFSTKAYHSLNQDEKWAFERLLQEASERAQCEWESQGRRLLGFMKDTTRMLVCAEDLGTIPDSVPKVLQDLGILGLKVNRWARDWNAPGQPYFPVRDYPELSVCTPSVHDTSTLRQWWNEEPDHEGFLQALGLDRRQDGPYTPDLAHRVLGALMTARSRLCIVPLQDWFALDGELLTESPEAERINTPGTVGGSNWAWRTKTYLEDLLARTSFTSIVRELVQRRPQ